MTSSFWYSDLFFNLFYYYILTSLIVCFHVVCVPNAAHAVLCLVFLFILVSFLFILIGAEYIGLIYIIVYVGAIAVLFLFVVMLLDLRNLTFPGFSKRGIVLFTLSILMLSDMTLYSLGYAQMPFFLLPLIPVSSLIDLQGEGGSIVDNLSLLSPALYNIFWCYVIACGFLLVFVMIGIVLMLGETLFFANTKARLRNKITVQSERVVHISRNRDGI